LVVFFATGAARVPLRAPLLFDDHRERRERSKQLGVGAASVNGEEIDAVLVGESPVLSPGDIEPAVPRVRAVADSGSSTRYLDWLVRFDTADSGKGKALRRIERGSRIASCQ